MNDVVVPIVFPDYRIRVDTPPVRIDVPNWVPGVGDEVTIPGTNTRVPFLGHAGALFFDGVSGLTKYYEYGRYDPANRGIVRRHRIPNVRVGRGNLPTLETLRTVLLRISQRAGQGGRIVGAYITLSSRAFERMLNYAESRMRHNVDPNRPAYDLLTNSCLHFMKQVAEAGGAQMPNSIDPRPAGYIDAVRSNFQNLDYQGQALTIEGVQLP